MPSTKYKIIILQPTSIPSSYETQIARLKHLVFGDISIEEIEDDFYAKPFAMILVINGDEVVGYTSLVKRNIVYEGKEIMIGGLGGLMTKKSERGRGIGGMIVQKTLEILKEEKIDVAFHSIDTESTMDGFYERYGFKNMNQKFSWKSRKGEIKSDFGGMIAPVNSYEFFSSILHGKEILYIGEGYW